LSQKPSSTRATCRVVQPVCLSLVAIAASALGLALHGWDHTGLALAVVLALIGCLVMIRVFLGVRGLREHSRGLQESAREAEAHYIDVLRRIVRLVEARDRYHKGHSERVGDLSERLGRRMHLPAATCRLLNVAGQLHDIGLLAVPERILTRQGELATSDLQSIRQHPEAGYEVLRPLESLVDVLPAVRHHHERMNGTGYPDGLRGEEIPKATRILAVADAYDALTHDRPYRPALSVLAAVGELRRCAPDGFDPRVVDALAEELNVPAMEKARKRRQPQPA